MQGTVKEIKRAYARELKLIDLEKNPEAFQKLRAAYEAALKNAHQPETAVIQAAAPFPQPAPQAAPPDSAVAAPAPPPAPERAELAPPPAELPAAEAVPELIAELRLGIANTAQGRVADDELIWKDDIRALLDRLRPFNLAAQAEFEHQVGILLLGGWRPGHEALLVAASEVFGWNEAGWRWDNLGANGATLDAALALRHCLEHFEESERRHFRYVIRDLRQQYEPGREALVRDLPYAEFLEKQFAPLLAILTIPGRVEAWRQALRKPEPHLKFRYKFAIAAILIALFYVLKMVNRSPYPEQTPAPPPPPAEAVDHSLQAQELSAEQHRFIVYRIRKELPRAVRETQYDVILDSIGRPHEITLLQSSGDSANDYAVAEGIRDIPRYPAEFPRRFTFSY